MTKLSILEFQNKPIYEQLLLEEKLLRFDSRNYCLINRGSPRAIVMGLSGSIEHLLHMKKVERDHIPVIQRFSGGGTVIVDEDTLFITFIFSKNDLPVMPFPEPIMRWSFDLYRDAWQLPDFSLRENDYAIGQKKCGGNAQYIRKERWLHHTSFLWDYRKKNMEYLQIPQKQPAYRQGRNHADFLSALKKIAPSADALIEQLKRELVKRFDIQSVSCEAMPHHTGLSTRQIIL